MQTRNALLKIAKEELLDGKTELLNAKLLNPKEKKSTFSL
jgi:hypothetical protein